MTIGNDSVKTDLVEVGSLQLQHLKDAVPVDFIGGLSHFLVLTSASELGGDQLLTILVEQVKCGQVRTAGDLDELGESISHLSLRQSAEESKVEEGVDWRVVGTEAILIVAVVDSNLDADTGVDQANDGCGNADVVGVPSVCGAGESISLSRNCQSDCSAGSSVWQLIGIPFTHPATSVTKPPP